MSNKNIPQIKDAMLGAWRCIDVVHDEIHEGEFYSYPFVISLGTSSTHVISITTPANKTLHYKNEKLDSSGEKIMISLQEGATVTGGTTVSAYNHNRIHANVSSAVIKTGVTLSTAGITVSTAYIGGGTGTGGSKTGGGLTSQNEMILKTATTYAIVIQNGGAGASTVVCTPSYYEEED